MIFFPISNEMIDQLFTSECIKKSFIYLLTSFTTLLYGHHRRKQDRTFFKYKLYKKRWTKYKETDGQKDKRKTDKKKKKTRKRQEKKLKNKKQKKKKNR